MSNEQLEYLAIVYRSLDASYRARVSFEDFLAARSARLTVVEYRAGKERENGNNRQSLS